MLRFKSVNMVLPMSMNYLTKEYNLIFYKIAEFSFTEMQFGMASLDADQHLTGTILTKKLIMVTNKHSDPNFGFELAIQPQYNPNLQQLTLNHSIMWGEE